MTDSQATPARILHSLAGEPPQKLVEDQGGACRLCGLRHGRTAPYQRWQGANFTDQNGLAAVDSDRICEPCIYVCAWNPPPGFEVPEDAKRGPNLRLFWHVYDAGEYLYGNKADKPTLRRWLAGERKGPWFCAIADSGHKHVLMETPLNPGPGGAVRFETQTTQPPDPRLVSDMTDLLSWGITKEEISSGRYSAQHVLHLNRPVREFQNQPLASRGGSSWDLAVWLAQRDQELHDERRGMDRRDLGLVRRPGVVC